MKIIKLLIFFLLPALAFSQAQKDNTCWTVATKNSRFNTVLVKGTQIKIKDSIGVFYFFDTTFYEKDSMTTVFRSGFYKRLASQSISGTVFDTLSGIGLNMLSKYQAHQIYQTLLTFVGDTTIFLNADDYFSKINYNNLINKPTIPRGDSLQYTVLDTNARNALVLKKGMLVFTTKDSSLYQYVQIMPDTVYLCRYNTFISTYVKYRYQGFLKGKIGLSNHDSLTCLGCIAGYCTPPPVWTIYGANSYKWVKIYPSSYKVLTDKPTIPSASSILWKDQIGGITPKDTTKHLDIIGISNLRNTAIQGGWIPNPQNPVPDNGFYGEYNLIYKDDTLWDIYRYDLSNHLSIDHIYLRPSVDSNFSTWGTPINLHNTAGGGIITGYEPSIFKSGNIYYMLLANLGYGNDNFYIWSSSDLKNWTIINSGNPVLTHSSSTSSPLYSVHNPAISIRLDTLDMIVQYGSKQGADSGIWNLYHSYVLTSSLSGAINFDTHLSALPIAQQAADPDVKYIPSRNAFFLIYTDYREYNNAPPYPNESEGIINAKYALVGTNLNLGSNWKDCKNFPVIWKNRVIVADPSFTEVSGKKVGTESATMPGKMS